VEKYSGNIELRTEGGYFDIVVEIPKFALER
jgi:hypothetical protein